MRKNNPVLRIETDPVELFTFTQLNKYPFFWSPSELASCLMIRVLRGDTTIGFVWGEWADPGVMTFHGCAAVGQRLPVFSSDLMSALCAAAFFVGANEIETSLSEHPRPEPIRRLLLRLGFTEGDDIFSLNLWNKLNGHQARDEVHQS